MVEPNYPIVVCAYRAAASFGNFCSPANAPTVELNIPWMNSSALFPCSGAQSAAVKGTGCVANNGFAFAPL